jgi:predicted ester cyclase
MAAYNGCSWRNRRFRALPIFCSNADLLIVEPTSVAASRGEMHFQCGSSASRRAMSAFCAATLFSFAHYFKTAQGRDNYDSTT